MSSSPSNSTHLAFGDKSAVPLTIRSATFQRNLNINYKFYKDYKDYSICKHY